MRPLVWFLLVLTVVNLAVWSLGSSWPEANLAAGIVGIWLTYSVAVSELR